MNPQSLNQRNPNRWQRNQSSPNFLQLGKFQIHKPMEMPRPSSKINLNEVPGHSYVTNLQRNQHPMKVIEQGPLGYVPPIGIHPQTQNGVLARLNPGSTNFHPMYENANANANIGVVTGNTPHFFNVMGNSTMMVQVSEQHYKLFSAYTQNKHNPLNIVQVSSPVPTGWGLQYGEGLNLGRFPVAQNIVSGHNYPQNYCNQEYNKLICGQAAPDSLQKGRTISDIKNVDLDKTEKEHMSTKGMSVLELLRLQERHFSPCNIQPPFHMDENPDQVVSLGQQKKRKAHEPSQLSRKKLQQSVSSCGLLHATRDPSPKVVPMQDDNVFKSLGVGGCSTPAAIFLVSSIPKKDPPCFFNQNPTDIMDVDDERYFRTAEDQRIRDKSLL